METVHSCNFCEEALYGLELTAEDHYSGEKFSLVKCGNCGLIFTNPRPSKGELSNYYPDSYYGESGIRFHPNLEKIIYYFRKKLANRIFDQYPEGGRILEIGTGRGTLLAEMSSNGWETFGTEYSDSLAESVENEFNIRIYPTPNLEDCDLPDKFFDVIVCYHVLEHLPDPSGTLYEVKRILRDSGSLIIAVPNIDGSIAKISKEYWFALDVPRHLFHFTPETLSNMLEKTGFKNNYKSTLSLEQDIFGFAQSILNLIGFPFNAFYDFIRSPSAKLRHHATKEINFINILIFTILILLGIVLCIIGTPIAIINGKIGKGGTIELWAQ